MVYQQPDYELRPLSGHQQFGKGAKLGKNKNV
jgi:hypothetical protein